MALVNMRNMISHAYENIYAVGAFGVVNSIFLEAILSAAERCRAPVILNISACHFADEDLRLLMPAVEAAARRATVPVAIHYDHAVNKEAAIKAINLGANGVMVDTAHEMLPDNIAKTRQVVEMAHACAVSVEGDLGYVTGYENNNAEESAHHEQSYTMPSEAKVYVEKTGIDYLAVSIGTAHGRIKRRAKLDLARLKQISAVTKIPLVIHGGTGLSDDQFRRLITSGVAKINYYTSLSDIAEGTVKTVAKSKRDFTFNTILDDVKHSLTAEVERCLRLWGSAGRAAEVLAQSQPWVSVEHLVAYNVEVLPGVSHEFMIQEGQRILSTIPGVRKVFFGKSVKEESRYRYCWLVSFVHPTVIDSYRDHPAHVAFADRLFRPMAGDRLSIDFLEIQPDYLVSKLSSIMMPQIMNG